MKTFFELTYGDFLLQQEDEIMSAVLHCGIVVDKPRLIKALSDARDFYREGYEDGRREALMNHDHTHCLDFRHYCPAKCFRAQLERDRMSRTDLVGVPLSYSHLCGTPDCPRKGEEPVTRDEYLENHGLDDREPNLREDEEPHCPVCGGDCETIYLREGDVIGCDACVKWVDAWDYATEKERTCSL